MRITIVTVSYNSAMTIRETLASVAAQDWQDIEHIVIDGASTDNTSEIVESFDYPGLSHYSEPDSGIYDAMNKGLYKATGDYILFLNSDDLFVNSAAVRTIADAALASDADMIFADTRFIAEPSRPLSGRLYSARRFRPWWLRIGVMPPHPSMAVRRATLLELGGFQTDFRIAGDFDLVARAILKYRKTWFSVPIVTTLFRTGGVSTSGLQSKLTTGREMARSLEALGQRFALGIVQLRFFLKAWQLVPKRK